MVEITIKMTWRVCSRNFKKTPNEPEVEEEPKSESNKTSKWTHALVLGTILITVVATFSSMTYVIVNQNSKIQAFEEFMAKIPNFNAIINHDHSADERLFDIALEIGERSWTKAILENQSQECKGLQLMHGLKENDIHKVDYLLANGADENVGSQCGPNGEFPIILAANQNMTKMVKRFLHPRFGTSPNVRNAKGESPLKAAAWNNNLEMAKTLLEFGADVNVRDNDHMIPLHFAVKRSDGAAMSKLLLDHGSKVDYKDRYGKTPLFYSSKETTQLLIFFGANVEAEDNDLRTPILQEIVDRGTHGDEL